MGLRQLGGSSSAGRAHESQRADTDRFAAGGEHARTATNPVRRRPRRGSAHSEQMLEKRPKRLTLSHFSGASDAVRHAGTRSATCLMAI
jgi:hypothetical protein